MGLLILTAAILFSDASAVAHPHAYLACTLSFSMDKKGLVGFRQHWVLDELTTASVMDVVDANRDMKLSLKEKKALRDMTVESLRTFHYFTAVRINGREFQVQTITDFSAELKSGRLVYDFMVPCPVAAEPGRRQEVKVAVYDQSFYTYVAYTAENDTGIDPTKDPKFGAREAPARPEDFERFSKAVGIGKYEGGIQITGDSARFKIVTKVKDEPDMAYFYDQIVPQTFILEFEPR